MEIAAQVFGILAFIVSVVSFQLKTYRQILWAQTLCALLFVTHFYLLTCCGQADAVTGATPKAETEGKEQKMILTIEETDAEADNDSGDRILGDCGGNRNRNLEQPGVPAVHCGDGAEYGGPVHSGSEHGAGVHYDLSAFCLRV